VDKLGFVIVNMLFYLLITLMVKRQDKT